MEQLYRATEREMFIFARRIVQDHWKAEEVLQDVYTYVWLHATMYTGERGSPLAWLYMLARSRALDSMRRSKNRQCETNLNEEVRVLTIDDKPFASTEVWRNTVVRRGVHQLPAAQERLVKMAFYEGYTHSEIAHTTGLPLGTVKARLRIAIGKLRESLAVEEGREDRTLPLAA